MKYPLSWPTQFPRAKYRTHSAFKNHGQYHSLDKACRFLGEELERLRATEPILSTNVELRLDGQPRGDKPPPQDKGAAVYFKLKGRPIALACDKWDRVACNVWAIAKHIESIRGQERWGVGNIEQAFTGYLALPAPGDAPADNCWEVLMLKDHQRNEASVQANYRALAQSCHPDRGGSERAMAALNKARDEALASLRRTS